MKSFLKSFSKKMDKKAVQNYTEATLFPVLRVNHLVPKSDRMRFLAKLNETLQLPTEHFQALYSDLLDRFIEFVQILPSLYGGYLGSLIFESMHRAHMAIQLLYDTADNRPDPLYAYAVFSMALLLDVNRVMSSQKVVISDDLGNYLVDWCPFNGSMVGQGEYFKIREYHGHGEAFLHSVNPLLAQKVMPDVGLAWLASDSQIFDMWLQVLTGHEEWAGPLGQLLKLLRKLLAELGLLGEIDARLVDVEGWQPEASAGAEQFLKWLKDGLEDGSISVNKEDSLVHVTDEGLWLQVPEIYHAFNKTYASFRDWHVLQAHFNNLGLPMLSGYDYKHMQYFTERADVSSRLGFLGHAKEKAHAPEHQSMIIKDTGLVLKDPSKYGNSKYLKSSKIQVKQSARLPKLAGSVAAIKAQQNRSK